MPKTNKCKKFVRFFIFYFLFFILTVPQLVFAIAFGHVGGVPANPDPNVELSKSYFIYNLPPGESKEDEILVMNLAENAQNILLYAVDSTVNNLGSFACERYIDPRDEIGKWTRFKVFAPRPIAKGETERFWQEKAAKEEALKSATSTDSVATTTEAIKEGFKVSETNQGLQIENPKHKFIIFDPLNDAIFATSSDLFVIPTSTEEFIFPTSTADLIVATTIGELIIQLAAGQKKKVPFTISIPENIETGEHSGGIIVKPILPPVKAEGSVMIIETQICVKITETVPGKIIKKLSLVSFALNLEGEKYLPTLIVRNESNISLPVEAKITMSGFGLAERFKVFAKIEKGIQQEVPKGAETKIFERFDKPYFGHFNFQGEIAYDSEAGKEILKTQRISVWVIPWRDVIILAVIILILALIISTWLILRQRRYSTRGWKLYTVAPGDDIIGLADKYNLAWKVLAKANKIKKPYIIKPGQTILVPDLLELQPEAKITFKQIIREKIMSKLYSIIIVLLIVGLVLVGGTWLYNKIFSQTTEMEETNINQQIPPEPKIPEVNLNTNAQLPIAPTSTLPIAPEEATTTPTTTPAQEVDKSLKISVLNGSGISGLAGKLATTLEEAGWLNTATGNADNFNYQNLTIRYQPNYAASAEDLKKLLAVDYAVINMEEKAGLVTPIEIVIGK